MKPIDIKTAPYFPLGFQLAGVIMLIASIAVAFVIFWVAIPMVIVGLLICSTHYRLQIDLEKKTWFEYTRVLGFKTGERGSFERIEYMYVNKSKKSVTMSSRVHSSTVVTDEYNAYVKLSDNLKLHLRSNSNKSALIKRMLPVSVSLGCELKDLTQS